MRYSKTYLQLLIGKLNFNYKHLGVDPQNNLWCDVAATKVHSSDKTESPCLLLIGNSVINA